MRRRHTETESPAAVVNLTPLLDMVFILLIFFLVSSSFLKETGIEVDRPGAETAVLQRPGSIVVAVDAEGAIWIDRRRIDPPTLRLEIERLHAADPQGGVIITADKDSRTGLLVKVMDQIRLAGVSNVALATSRDDGRP